ncbi:MAG: type III-A CRISPR-associated RAMP protein Csm5 [Chlorobium phaeobacteroides]|uniref:CRISPR system Cms protein Csm5 n=1 Tax=Chlorobium phaeobacteroides (strain BS1) TaxID=331678 RepID=B3EIY8_CHLPB|nr:type III-A CRISPR-associated RAMP protein Csm5 [Chlorobium phaeobacteroides]
MTKALISHKVSLTTLSPVFIGAGAEHVLSPYSDFVQRGDSLIYIDTDRLQDAMQGDKALIEAFVKGMRHIENNRLTFVLEKFITGTLGREVDDFAARVVRIDGDIQKNHIRRFIATGGKPFIPGSSLKGAIRTAVLVDWLLNRKAGEPIFNQIRENINKRDRRSLKDMNLEQACFGTISRDVFRNLRISDSSVIESSSLWVGEMRRVALPTEKKKKQQQSSIPQWSEVIGPSVETTFPLSLTTPIEKTGFDFLDHQSVTKLFPIINRISLDSCLRELGELKGNQDFRDFFRFYEKLEQEITSLKTDEAILRLGGGKTWFDNSLGLSIDCEEFRPEALLKKYLDLVLDFKHDPFPSTRSAIVRNGVPVYPLGWVKLTLLKN